MSRNRLWYLLHTNTDTHMNCFSSLTVLGNNQLFHFSNERIIEIAFQANMSNCPNGHCFGQNYVSMCGDIFMVAYGILLFHCIFLSFMK